MHFTLHQIHVFQKPFRHMFQDQSATIILLNYTYSVCDFPAHNTTHFVLTEGGGMITKIQCKIPKLKKRKGFTNAVHRFIWGPNESHAMTLKHHLSI